jgi:hypothetical protein
VTTAAPQPASVAPVTPAAGPQNTSTSDGGNGGTEAPSTPQGGGPQTNQATPDVTAGTSAPATQPAAVPQASAPQVAPQVAPQAVQQTVSAVLPLRAAQGSFPWWIVVSGLSVAGFTYLRALGRRRRFEKSEAMDAELRSISETTTPTTVASPTFVRKSTVVA